MINLKRDFDIDDLILKSFLNLSGEEKKMVRSWRNHENIRKWMYSGSIISLEDHAKFLNQLKEDDKNFYWIVVNKDCAYIGTIYLNRMDFNNRHTYMGIYSNPYSGLKNKGTLLFQSIRKLAFKFAKLHTLKLEVMDNNQKAIKFYKKSGFNEEGRLKEFVYKNGLWHDVIVMGITNTL